LAWVRELEYGPLDQFEYLGALQRRDEVELRLQLSGDQLILDVVAEIDAREALTVEDNRFTDGSQLKRAAAGGGAASRLTQSRSATSARTGGTGAMVSLDTRALNP
jgi:hypothetical protein